MTTSQNHSWGILFIRQADKIMICQRILLVNEKAPDKGRLSILIILNKINLSNFAIKMYVLLWPKRRTISILNVTENEHKLSLNYHKLLRKPLDSD